MCCKGFATAGAEKENCLAVVGIVMIGFRWCRRHKTIVSLGIR